MAGDTNHVIAVLEGWPSGQITFYPADRLPITALTRAQNLFVEEDQAVKRFGVTRQNAVDLTTGQAVYSAYFSNGLISDKLVVTSDDKVIDLSTGAQVDIGSGFAANQRWGFAEAQSSGTDYIFMYAEGNAPRKWTGAGATVAASGPAVNCRYAAWHKERMWACRSTDRRLFLSGRFRPETWGALDFIPILRPQDGLWTGLVSMDDYLIAFSEGRIYLVYGHNPTPPNVNISVRPVPAHIGCIAPLSIAKDTKTNAVYFVAMDGIYAMEGQTVKLLSRAIQADFDGIEKAAIDKCASVIYKDTLWISVPFGAGQATNNRTYVFHIRKQNVPVTYFTGWAPNCWAKNDLIQKVYFGDAATPRVYYYDETVSADNGSAIDFDLITAGIPGKNFFETASPLRLQLQATAVAAGTVAVEYGQNDIAVAGFTAAPSSPISIDTSGPVYGDASGPSVARNGVVDYVVNLPRDGEVLHGSYFRFRIRDVSTNPFRLRRLRVYQQSDRPPLEES